MRIATVIGDIHGSARQLETLLGAVATRSALLIFLGDYVNRGPDSKSVLETLTNLSNRGGETVFLCGNHDWAFQQYLLGADFEAFAMMGGLMTINSYLTSGAVGDVREQMLAVVPRTHREFLHGLRTYYEDGQLLCSHCGLDPVSPDDRTFKTMVLDPHSELFHCSAGIQKGLICGHYPQLSLRPFVRERFVCVDTGCGTLPGGCLTALLLPEFEYIQVSPSGQVSRYSLIAGR
jgi:serine/threonine protein phosphatase 1